MRFRSMLLEGRLTHSRLRPVRHRFGYRVCFLLLDVDELPRLNRELFGFGHNRWALWSIRDRDYGRGPTLPLRESIERTLRAHGIRESPSRVELLTQPRTVCYGFNPVSYFFCSNGDGSLACVVAEVNNTFGDRIRYLLDGEKQVPWPGGVAYRQPKQMHVSPFMPLGLEYQFCFRRGPRSLTVRVDERCGDDRFFRAELAGELRPLTVWSLWRAALGYPMQPARVMGFIHWQALKLYRKGAPFHSRPPFDEAWTRAERTA